MEFNRELRNDVLAGTLRHRAAHAGPIDEDTLVYRIEFHAISPGD
jgi:hypothetical protein